MNRRPTKTKDQQDKGKHKICSFLRYFLFVNFTGKNNLLYGVWTLLKPNIICCRTVGILLQKHLATELASHLSSLDDNM